MIRKVQEEEERRKRERESEEKKLKGHQEYFQKYYLKSDSNPDPNAEDKEDETETTRSSAQIGTPTNPITPRSDSPNAQDTVNKPSDLKVQAPIQNLSELDHLKQENERLKQQIELEKLQKERRIKAQDKKAELRSLTKDYKFKVVVIGPPGVGKTCILVQLVKQFFDESGPGTLSCETGVHLAKVDKKVVELTIWDTAGQESYRSLGRNFYRGSHGLIVVYDLADRDSFVDIDSWLEEGYKNCVDNAVALLIGNKSDLSDRRQVTEEEAKLWAHKQGIRHMEASAKTSENIDEIFELLSHLLIEKVQRKELEYEDPAARHVTRVTYSPQKIQQKNNNCDC